MKPDFKILAKYLPLAIRSEASYYSYMATLDELEVSIREILNYHNLLEKHEANMYFFARYYATRIAEVNHNVSHRLKQNNLVEDFKQVKKILNILNGGNLNKISFSTHMDTVNITSNQIISDISKSLEPLLKEYNKALIIEDFSPKSKSVDRVQSHIKEFTKSLTFLFAYLKNETVFMFISNNKCYQFIADFSELLGMDFESQNSARYIHDTFKNLKG